MAQTKVYSIKEILDIPGKDRIKLIRLNETAYEFIVNIETDPYKINDKVIMILNDSLIPETEVTKRLSCYAMLKEKFFNEKLQLIRTKVVKFAGFRSVGLLENPKNINKEVSIGDELDEYFGITKYEPDELEASPTRVDKKLTFMQKVSKWTYNNIPWLARLIWGENLRLQYPFPTDLISISDEENAQNIINQIEFHKNDACIITLKMEGQSGTYLIVNGKFRVCSRKLAYDWDAFNKKYLTVSGYSTSNYFEVTKKYRLKEALEKYKELTGHDIIFQGEICGPGIQKNIYKFKELRYFIYRVKDLTEKRVLSVDEVIKVIELLNSNGFTLEQVPIVERFNHLSDFITSTNVEEMVKWMEVNNYFEPATDTSDWKWFWKSGKANQKTKFINEGIVIYCGSFSFKLKSLLYKEWFG